ncbi:hypothetical protein [Nostoc sp. 106C]|nr:hypothetical protein [Nostoc sp. 106C]
MLLTTSLQSTTLIQKSLKILLTKLISPNPSDLTPPPGAKPA